MNENTYKKVIAEVKTMVPLKFDCASINAETEIYADLRIYGDDLLEFLLWIETEFRVKISIAGDKYVPSETPFFALAEAFKKFVGGGVHRYKSLKIRDIVEAIDAGGRQFD